MTYAEVLRSVADQHPLIGEATANLAAAGGGLLESQSVFDPLWRTGSSWNSVATRQYSTYPFPFEATQRTWAAFTALEGAAPTGTTWSVGMGLDHVHVPSLAVDEITRKSLLVDVDDYGAALQAGLTQELLRGATLAYNLQSVRASRATVQSAEHAAAAARQAALAGAAQAYWLWVQSAGEAAIARTASEVALQSLEIARGAALQGGVGAAYVARLEAAAALRAGSLARAEVAAGQAEDQVRAWTGESPGTSWTAATPPGDGLASVLDPVAVVAAALAASPELLAARADAEAARAAERATRASRLPTLTATALAGVAGRDVDSVGGAAANLFQHGHQLPFASVGGELVVPIGGRAGRGEQARTQGELAAADHRVTLLEREVGAATTSQVRALAAAAVEIGAGDTQVRALGEALAAEEASLAQGGSHPQFVLDQRQALVDAEVEALAARTRWRAALTELQRLQGALGTELP